MQLILTTIRKFNIIIFLFHSDININFFNGYFKIMEIFINRRSSNGFDDYKVAENCQKYPRLAENLCPSTCALCCKTLDYSCADLANCANITRAMCQTAGFYDALLRMCPRTCGLCRRPGADGCSHARIKELCQRSCNSLDCLSQTTAPALSVCRDERVNCRSRPDLCVGPYAAVYANQCKFTCGLCNRG
ncbi:unnamed protein product [Dracunculus medinensis]|uniref:ShKT domain-containing protein n=1 Tax=Dracunculus medinensis TaxID=318479 RepID=A0A0N4UPU9_DRAME|nr:unnamed protein product [Dracunculus medinensis]